MTSSQTLLHAQQAFMAQVLDDDQPVPDNWSERQAAGMDVYRQNYRSAVIDAVTSTYEQTRQWVGEELFQRAAIHHVIAHPPSGWTIDDAGAGFAETCQQLFADDPAVAELAWLEWAMLGASRAAEATPLSMEDFGQATAQFGDEDWASMTIEFLPGVAARPLQHDLHAMWQALAAGLQQRPETTLQDTRGCIVWREAERPTFMMVEADMVLALQSALAAMPYGEICLQLAGDNPDEQTLHDAAMRAGAMLGQWLQERLIVGLNA